MQSIRLAIAALLCLTGLTRDAGATATITLEWGACAGGTMACTGIGTSTIAVDYLSPGQTLRLDVYLQHDEVSGINAHAFSLNFDTDLGNELNLTGMAAIEWVGTDTHPGPLVEIYGPFTSGTQGNLESTAVNAGRINSYESGTVLSTNLPRTGVAYTVGTFTATAPARYRVGQAFFTTTSNFSIDGADVFAGSFNGLADVTANGNNEIVTMNFGTASVNLLPGIPEPGTLSLLGLGLVGLVLAARRSRA